MYLKEKFIHEKGARCQFPTGGTFSCRYCRARSVHFISCSLTDSVVPPLSCSGSGSSFWKGTRDIQNNGILYVNKRLKTQEYVELKPEFLETGSMIDTSVSQRKSQNKETWGSVSYRSGPLQKGPVALWLLCGRQRGRRLRAQASRSHRDPRPWVHRLLGYSGKVFKPLELSFPLWKWKDNGAITSQDGCETNCGNSERVLSPAWDIPAQGVFAIISSGWESWE